MLIIQRITYIEKKLKHAERETGDGITHGFQQWLLHLIIPDNLSGKSYWILPSLSEI